MKKCLFLLVVFCCLASACASSRKLESGDVSQDDIHQRYTIRRTDESLEIRAQFRLNNRLGDTLALSRPSRVSYNGKEMTRRDEFMTGAVYFADEKSYQAANQFEFIDINGKTYVNAISLEPLEFAAASPQLKKTAAAIIPVTRVRSGDGDDVKIVMTITDSTRKDFSSEVRGGRGVIGFRSSVYFDEAKKAIVIEPDFLKDVAEGVVTISLVTHKDKDKLEQATGRGGEMSVEYAAKPISANLSSK